MTISILSAGQPAGRMIDADPDASLTGAVEPGAQRIVPVVAVRWVRVIVLVLALPLFGQLFSYVKEVPAMWSLAKAFPVISTPFALFLLPRPRMEGGRQLLFTFLFLVLVSSLIAGFTFNQSFFRSLTSQVKLLPLLSAFNFLGFLYLVRPTLREISLSFLICGALTLILLVYLWLTVPETSYSQVYTVGGGQMFSHDARGDRIRMPVYIALIAMFYWWRSFLLTRRGPYFALAAAGYGLIVYMVKLRAMVISIAVVAAINLFIAAPPRWRLLVLLVIPLAGYMLFRVGYVASILDTTDQGYLIRQGTSDRAIAFLGDNPFLWLFGAGSLSSLDAAAMMRYFHHFFFLADITWMGIIFEFGVVGALLLAALPVRTLVIGHYLRGTIDTPFFAALQDSVLYTLVISPLYPMTLEPGELVLPLAIYAYIQTLIGQAAAEAA